MSVEPCLQTQAAHLEFGCELVGQTALPMQHLAELLDEFAQTLVMDGLASVLLAQPRRQVAKARKPIEIKA